MLKEQHQDANPAIPRLAHGKEIVISGKNQITLPKSTTDSTGWKRGDRLIVEVLRGDMVVLMRRPTDWVETFAGALSDVFGSSEDTRAYLEQEREAWDQPLE